MEPGVTAAIDELRDLTAVELRSSTGTCLVKSRNSQANIFFLGASPGVLGSDPSGGAMVVRP